MRYKRKRDKCFWTMARSYLHDYMPAIRNLSDKTIETYKQSLKTYLRFLKEKKNIEDELVSFEAFTRDYVKEFIIWLKGQGASTRTINLRITSIRSFLKYCGQEDFELRGIYESVCQIQKLKEEKHPILYLRPEATAAILSAYDMNTQKHRRNRMILILLYDTGARVQELADLDIESLHLDVPNPYISIIGKGRKRRNVPIMRKTVAHLNSYLKEFHPSEQSAPLFYSMRDGKPHRLSTDSISLVVGTAAKMARETCNAVPENVHCHLFRKTKAMDLYKNGIPLPFIMQLLGHESISTTSGFYAFATLEMMSDAINKSVPIIGGTEKLWKNKNAKQALYTLDRKYYTEKSYVESAYLQDSEIFRYRNLLGIISTDDEVILFGQVTLLMECCRQEPAEITVRITGYKNGHFLSPFSIHSTSCSSTTSESRKWMWMVSASSTVIFWMTCRTSSLSNSV